MACPGARLCLLIGLLGVAGCAGYRQVNLPWEEQPQAGEFGTQSDIRVGDRVRVTWSGDRVCEGSLLTIDQSALTLVETSGTTPLTIPADSVRRVEVYDEGLGTKGVAVASVAVATAVVLVVVHANSESVFSPDEPAKTQVEGCRMTSLRR